MVMLALCLGAGLTSQELSRAVGTEVIRDHDGVLVKVMGAKARVVPVVERWERQAETFAMEAGVRPILKPERGRIRDYDVTNLAELAARSSLGNAPKLSPLRLRTTWIVDRISAGVPVLDVADAAGVTRHQISRYLEFARRIDPAKARRLLRRSPDR
jgi:hypothetical protein